MLLITLTSSIVLGLASTQTPCEAMTTTTTFSPIPMRYTPFMTPQIAPVSTIYETIITTWYNAIDCKYLTPIQVDENPIAEGPFTTLVRSPVLTVTRVGCLPETSVATRGDQLELRAPVAEQNKKVYKRRTTHEAIVEVITQMEDSFPPDTASLTVQAYRYLVSVNTAIFAIHLVQAGIDLNQTCIMLREPISQTKLFRTTIDPVQAADIVCFAASNGLYFEAGIDRVITYLESLIYALQVRADYSEDSTDFCWPLFTQDSPFLGIDTNGIANYLCPGSAPTPTPKLPGTNTPKIPVNPGTTGTGTGTGTGSNPVVTAGPPTGGPFVNTTAIDGTGVPRPTLNGTAVLTPTAPAPFTNSTTTDALTETATDSSDLSTITNIGTAGTIGTYGTGWVSVNATGAPFGTGTIIGTGNLPPVPTSIIPEIESITPTPSRRLRRW